MQSGSYTVEQIMAELEFSMDGITDYRRVKVGGLGFDDLSKVIRVPESAETIEITLDGDVVASQDVE